MLNIILTGLWLWKDDPCQYESFLQVLSGTEGIPLEESHQGREMSKSGDIRSAGRLNGKNIRL